MRPTSILFAMAVSWTTTVPQAAAQGISGEAEIVSVTDARLDTAVTPGVRVYGESGGRWPAARRIWNQFQYGVTNVDDDGTVPRHETRNLALGHRWAQAGSVREGALVPSCAFPRPDLTASALRVEKAAGVVEKVVEPADVVGRQAHQRGRIRPPRPGCAPRRR